MNRNEFTTEIYNFLWFLKHKKKREKKLRELLKTDMIVIGR